MGLLGSSAMGWGHLGVGHQDTILLNFPPKMHELEGFPCLLTAIHKAAGLMVPGHSDWYYS